MPLAKARRAAGGHTAEQRSEPTSKSPKRLSPFNRCRAAVDDAIMDAASPRAHALSRDLSRAASDGEYALQRVPQLGQRERLYEPRDITEVPLGDFIASHEGEGDVSIREDLCDRQRTVQAKLDIK